MKIKMKLSLIVIVIVVVVAGGLAVILLRQASGISMNMSIGRMAYLNDQQATYWEGRENVNIKVLNSLANLMGDYESVPAGERDRKSVV
jgi:hypothetical protein